VLIHYHINMVLFVNNVMKTINTFILYLDTLCKVVLYFNLSALSDCIGLMIHCNHHVGHYSGFSRISPSVLNRFTPNLQA